LQLFARLIFLLTTPLAIDPLQTRYMQSSPGNSRNKNWWKYKFWVADRRWTPQTSRRPAGRSTSVGRQRYWL